MLDKKVRPKHIQFHVSTESPELESCDFRLTTLMDKEQLTVITTLVDSVVKVIMKRSSKYRKRTRK